MVEIRGISVRGCLFSDEVASAAATGGAVRSAIALIMIAEEILEKVMRLLRI
jgi:hypothetical protein